MEYLGSVKQKENKWLWEIYFYHSFLYNDPYFEQKPIAVMQSTESFDTEKEAKEDMEMMIHDLGL